MSGKVEAPPPMYFHTWTTMQAKHVRLHLNRPMPPALEIQAPRLDYWGAEKTQLVRRGTTSSQFVLDQATSTAFLSCCNDAFGTEFSELMIAAPVYSFSLVFTERPAPPVFAEGHGRQPWDDSIDISRAVSWFTIYPVKVPSGTGVDLKDTVRHAKDWMRSLPQKGWSYFTSKFADAASASANISDFPVEVCFNYSGLYQQLERKDALFEELEMPRDRIRTLSTTRHALRSSMS